MMSKLSAAFASKFRLLAGGVVGDASKYLISKAPGKEGLFSRFRDFVHKNVRLQLFLKAAGIFGAADITHTIYSMLSTSPELLKGYIFDNFAYILLVAAIASYIIYPIVRNLLLKLFRSGFSSSVENPDLNSFSRRFLTIGNSFIYYIPDRKEPSAEAVQVRILH